MGEATTSGLALLLSLPHEFPNEWHDFVTSEDANFEATVKRDYFPYLTQGKQITIDAVQLHSVHPETQDVKSKTVVAFDLIALTDALKQEGALVLTLAPDAPEDADAVLVPDEEASIFLVIKYSMSTA